MALDNKKPGADIENIEHEDSSGCKKIVLHGLSSGIAIPIKLESDGTVVTNYS